MGSLAATGIPVPTKSPNTYRKYDRLLVKSTDNRDDSITTIISQGLENRAISSGSIVRDDNMSSPTVEYYEDVVWGLYQAGNSTTERIASDTGNARSLNVDAAVPQIVVLPSGDGEIRAYNTGGRIVRTRPSGDELVDRVANSGTYG